MRLFKKLFQIIHVPEPEVLRNFENVHVIESVATKRFLKQLHLLGEVKTVVAFADWDNFSRLVSEALHTKQSVKSELGASLCDGEIPMESAIGKGGFREISEKSKADLISIYFFNSPDDSNRYTSNNHGSWNGWSK
jgi:hypothetical protein